jgi:hypothetical protein
VRALLGLALIAACTTQREQISGDSVAPPPLVGKPAPTAPVDSSSSATLRAIESLGAPKILDSAFRNPAYEDWLDEHIASGDSGWLAVAARLRPASDASGSEDLDLALAGALPHAPERVLRLLGGRERFSFDWVCRGEIVMNDVDTLAADTTNAAYRVAARRALASVRDPSLRPRADSCAAAIGPR